jgi:hypothetical protein
MIFLGTRYYFHSHYYLKMMVKYFKTSSLIFWEWGFFLFLCQKFEKLFITCVEFFIIIIKLRICKFLSVGFELQALKVQEYKDRDSLDTLNCPINITSKCLLFLITTTTR